MKENLICELNYKVDKPYFGRKECILEKVWGQLPDPAFEKIIIDEPDLKGTRELYVSRSLIIGDSINCHIQREGNQLSGLVAKNVNNKYTFVAKLSDYDLTLYVFDLVNEKSFKRFCRDFFWFVVERNKNKKVNRK